MMIDSLTSQPLASDYYSFNGLQEIKSSVDEKKGLRAAAQQFESLFVKMLMTSMRKANEEFGKGGIFDSNEMKFYQEMFDNQISLTMSQGKGLGLADAMVRQLSPAHSESNTHDQFMNSSHSIKQRVRQSSAMKPLPVPQLHEDESQHDSVHELQKTDPESTIGGRLFKTAEDFVQTLYPIFSQVANKLSIDPKIMLAQAALETGWGKFIMHDQQGNFSNNLFSIKADNRWDGDKITVNTLEYREGIANKEKAAFRLYDSFSASVHDFVNFIANNGRYQKALHVKENAEQFISELQQAGFATDPHYADKVLRIYHSDTLNESLDKLGYRGLT